MTDILVLNQAQALLVANLAMIVVPVIMFFAFMIGRWSAWKWYERNAHEFAEAETRDKWVAAVNRSAEKDQEIEGLNTMLDGRETRIKELVAIVRAAQVQGVKQTEMLTMITGLGDQ